MRWSAAGQLHLRQFVPIGDFYHTARALYAPHRELSLHTHDFAEVFWIERGRGTHWINGERQRLTAGDLVLIRPQDVHGFGARDRAGFTLMNVAFAADVLEQLRQRYFESAPWPWMGDIQPASFMLDAGQRHRVEREAQRLVAGRQTRLKLDRFLLNLLGELSDERPGVSDAAVPDWLAQALHQFAADPEALIEGVPALAKLAGRSREHINRTLRRDAGKTTTDLINELRLNRAAEELRMTSKPILHVAVDCGLPNLGYFYRLFNARFGLTPRRYRLREQAVLRGI